MLIAIKTYISNLVRMSRFVEFNKNVTNKIKISDYVTF